MHLPTVPQCYGTIREDDEIDSIQNARWNIHVPEELVDNFKFGAKGKGTRSSSTPILTTSLSSEDERSVEESSQLWEIVYTGCVLAFMFVALISDRIGADSVMLVSLTLFMCAKIISVEEGLSGFSNEGLLTVLVLFVVAEGISKTGGEFCVL